MVAFTAGAAAGLGAATSIAQPFIQDILADSNAQDQMHRNMELMANQYAYNYTMYGNRYQWMMNDLVRAGLNPILAVSGGFSPSGSPGVGLPQAAYAGMPSAPDFAASALGYARTAEAEASKEKLTKEAELAGNKAKESLESANKMRAQQGLIGAQEAKVYEEIWRIQTEVDRMMSQIYLFEAQTDLAVEQRQLVEENKRKVVVEVKKLNAMLAELRKIAKVYDGPAGLYFSYAKEIAKFLGIPLGLIFGGKALRKK